MSERILLRVGAVVVLFVIRLAFAVDRASERTPEITIPHVDVSGPLAAADHIDRYVDAIALGQQLTDLGAPDEVVRAAEWSDSSDPAATLWLARARGASRASLEAAVEAGLRARIEPMAHRAALFAMLDGAPDGDEAASPGPTRHAVELFVQARAATGVLDMFWLEPLAEAARTLSADTLREALSDASREAPLGLASAAHLTGARLAGRTDEEIDILLLAHDAATGGRPDSLLRAAVVTAGFEADVAEHGVDVPAARFGEAAAAYRELGLERVAASVERNESGRTRSDEATRLRALLEREGAVAARAAHVRRVLGAP